MTPQEKANNIIERVSERVGRSKQISLIFVDEIILANPHSNPFNTDVHSTIDYWLQVKQEIEKL